MSQLVSQLQSLFGQMNVFATSNSTTTKTRTNPPVLS